jgi:predicted transcriptional regulator
MFFNWDLFNSEILEKLNPEKAILQKILKICNLNYYFFNDWHLKNMLEGGNLGCSC